VSLQSINGNVEEVMNYDDHSKASKTLISLQANGRQVTALVDTGATCSLISAPLNKELRLSTTPCDEPAVSITGDRLKILGSSFVRLVLAGKSHLHPVKVFDGCKYDLVLGTDYLRKIGPVQFDFKNKKVLVDDRSIRLEEFDNPSAPVFACEDKTIPPRSMALLLTGVSVPILPNVDLLFEQSPENPVPYLCPRIVVQSSQFPIRVVNPTNAPQHIFKATVMGYVEACEEIAASETPSHVKSRLSGLDLSKSDLNQNEQTRLRELLLKYKDLFAEKDDEIPGTDAFQYKLTLKDPHMMPLKQRAYRVPQAKREEIDNHIDKLLEADIIAPSASPWSSPVVLVSKKTGGSRLAIDYRALNEVTISDAYPLPRIDDALEFLSGAKYLTTLDCYSGFHQVPLDPDSRPLTAFITSRGLYEFKRLPFGVKQGPSCFARLMNFVLSGLLFSSAMIYLDDVLVAGKTFEEMLSRLEDVFVRLRQYSVKLKLKKCNFGCHELPFLGMLLTPKGIQPDKK
jgi:hypothetical protein